MDKTKIARRIIKKGKKKHFTLSVCIIFLLFHSLYFSQKLLFPKTLQIHDRF